MPKTLARSLADNVLAELGLPTDTQGGDPVVDGVRQAVGGAATRLGYRSDMPSTYYAITPVDVRRIAEAIAYDLHLSPLDPDYPDRIGALLTAVQRTQQEVSDATPPPVAAVGQ